MNRRKLLSLLGAAPVAALPAVAEIPTPIPATTPILGQLMYLLEPAPVYYYNGFVSPVDPYYFNNTHTHTFSSAASGGYTVAKLHIWDGEKWVDEDSQAGVDVKNKVLKCKV